MKNAKTIALAPAVVATVAFLLSPDFYDKLPDKYAHWIAMASVVVSTLLPQLFPRKDAKK